MTDSRNIEFDIEALVLAAVCVFLSLSLISFDPADSVGPLPGPLEALVPVDALVYPANEQVSNWCGWFGALIAQVLVQTLGIGSTLVVAGLIVLTVWMFRVQENFVRPSRQIGWVLVIVAATTFVALLRLPTPLSPVIGGGGYLGAMTSTWLNEHFATFGSVILTITVLLAGLLLSTDYVVVRACSMMLLGGASVATTAAAATKRRVSIPAPSGGLGRRRLTSDVDDGIQLPDDSSAKDSSTNEESIPPVKIRGQQLNRDDEPTLPSTEPAERKGLLGAASSLAAGLLGGKAAQNTAGDHSTLSEAALAEDIRSQDDVDEFEEEFVESDEVEIEELEEPEFREVAVGGELIQTRADEAHATSPEPAGPRVRSPKNKKAEKQAISDSLAHLDDTKLPAGAEEYVLPGLDLLLESDDVDFDKQAVEVRRKAKILESTFKDFGLNIRVVEIETGPVIAQYEIELEAGLRLSKITGLSDDLAIALRVPSVRIVAPIPGKNTVGIEVPNETRQVVRLREVIEEQGPKGQKAKIPLFLGKDVSGNALTADLATLPHLLIAGRTGTGKSVCLNAIIASILMTKKPDEVRMLMIDPKMVELSGYGRLPHLMHPVVTDMKKAEAILAWAVDKMEERYALLAKAGVRHLTNYNELGREELLDRLRPETPEEAEAIPDHLPFIVIVADEMADLMMTAGKEVEQHIIRLAQKSRAVGIHLILATQKPTVDVITGLIKSNLPARISFQVASRTDSRVVLDEMGADKLLGNGDMLFLWPGTSMLLRGQGTYLGDDEINRVVDHCSTGEQNFVNELVNLKVKEDEDGEDVVPGGFKKRDELYTAAVDVVVREGRGSCSLLQRALGIGYGRAARLIDFMAEDGIVGQYNGSQAREVVLSISEWESMQADDDSASGSVVEKSASKPAARSNKIRPADEETEDAAVKASSSATARQAGKVAEPQRRSSSDRQVTTDRDGGDNSPEKKDDQVAVVNRTRLSRDEVELDDAADGTEYDAEGDAEGEDALGDDIQDSASDYDDEEDYEYEDAEYEDAEDEDK